MTVEFLFFVMWKIGRKKNPPYFDCAEKLAAAKIAASTSTLSWESKLWRILWCAFFLSGMIDAMLPNILQTQIRKLSKHNEYEVMQDEIKEKCRRTGLKSWFLYKWELFYVHYRKRHTDSRHVTKTWKYWYQSSVSYLIKTNNRKVTILEYQ